MAIRRLAKKTSEVIRATTKATFAPRIELWVTIFVNWRSYPYMEEINERIVRLLLPTSEPMRLLGAVY